VVPVRFLSALESHHFLPPGLLQQIKLVETLGLSQEMIGAQQEWAGGRDGVEEGGGGCRGISVGVNEVRMRLGE
jgi:hypothetical protein